MAGRLSRLNHDYHICPKSTTDRGSLHVIVYNDGAKIFFLSICQSKLVSNWQESSGLKENIAKNIENIARMEILPDGEYFQKYCGRGKLPGDKYFKR